MGREYSLHGAEKKRVKSFDCEVWRKENTRKNLDIDGTILKQILRKYVEKSGLGSFGSWQGREAGFCPHGNKPSAYKEVGTFLD
jgi:hypothetical protein